MRRHPIDPLSLALGLALLFGGALWVAWDQEYAGRRELLIAAPLALIVGGVAGIILSAVAAKRRKGTSYD